MMAAPWTLPHGREVFFIGGPLSGQKLKMSPVESPFRHDGTDYVLVPVTVEYGGVTRDGVPAGPHVRLETWVWTVNGERESQLYRDVVFALQAAAAAGNVEIERALQLRSAG